MHKAVHDFLLGRIVPGSISSPPKSTADLALVLNLQLVMVERDVIYFLYDNSAFFSSMWEDKLEADGFTDAITDDIEKTLGPLHKSRK
jgi:hypothetical protein